MRWALRYRGSSGSVRAEPKTETAEPTLARASNPSTNSDWMRRTLHGSVCFQSVLDSGWSSDASAVRRGICVPRRTTDPRR